MSSQIPVTELFFVYNADWSLKGLVEATANFIRGVEECALCEIAFNGALPKREWKECKASFPIPIQVTYRNRLDQELEDAAAGNFPIVLGRSGEKVLPILGPEAIESCRGSVEEFKQRLLERIEVSDSV